MSESIGPRTYLVGKILPKLLFSFGAPDDCVTEAIRLADLTLDKMQWPLPNGKPHEVYLRLPKTRFVRSSAEHEQSPSEGIDSEYCDAAEARIRKVRETA